MVVKYVSAYPHRLIKLFMCRVMRLFGILNADIYLRFLELSTRVRQMGLHRSRWLNLHELT